MKQPRDKTVNKNTSVIRVDKLKIKKTTKQSSQTNKPRIIDVTLENIGKGFNL